MTSKIRRRFRGEICGFGTTSGHRIVVGRWVDSPLGVFADVMHESPSGHRTLLAPNEAVAEFVQTTYTFDDVRIVPVTTLRTVTTLEVEAGALVVRVGIGSRSGLGWALAAVPSRVATSPAWCRAIDPVARVVMRGVRTRGTAGNDRVESYGATDMRVLTTVEGVLDHVDLGDLADVWPPVHFGFGSTPRTPSIVSVVTTIDETGRRPPTA